MVGGRGTSVYRDRMCTIRQALRGVDRRRDEWWMVRRDSDPPGVWALTLDPSAGNWDWRVRAVTNMPFMRRRIASAKIVADKKGRLLELRRMVDRMRGAMVARGDDAAAKTPRGV